MKKSVLSIALCVTLLLAMAVPAMAEDSQDAALKQVTLTVKNTLGIDDSYTDYLALQSGQGFDLTKYAGKRVKRFSVGKCVKTML